MANDHSTLRTVPLYTLGPVPLRHWLKLRRKIEEHDLHIALERRAHKIPDAALMPNATADDLLRLFERYPNDRSPLTARAKAARQRIGVALGEIHQASDMGVIRVLGRRGAEDMPLTEIEPRLLYNFLRDVENIWRDSVMQLESGVTYYDIHIVTMEPGAVAAPDQKIEQVVALLDTLQMGSNGLPMIKKDQWKEIESRFGRGFITHRQFEEVRRRLHDDKSKSGRPQKK